MDPQISPWGDYCVGFGAICARLLGLLKGTVGRPWPGFPTRKHCVLTSFLPLRDFGCFPR